MNFDSFSVEYYTICINHCPHFMGCVRGIILCLTLICVVFLPLLYLSVFRTVGIVNSYTINTIGTFN